MCFEGFDPSLSPSFEPLTDCPLTDSQRSGDVLLLPALLFQLPRSLASFFSPIGSSRCSHTSYFITLYFSLPRSVIRARERLRHKRQIITACVLQRGYGSS